jgi:hypothetical protein
MISSPRRHQVPKEASDGVRVLDQEERDQQHQDRLEDPVEQHEDVFHHRGEVAREQGRQVADRVVVGLAQIDRDTEDGNDMVLVSEILEVAGDGGALGDERGELLADDGDQEEHDGREDGGNDCVERDEGSQPGDATPLGRIHRRVEQHGQDPGEDEGSQNASDGEGKDQGEDSQDAKEDQGAEVAAPPQLIHPATLHHRGIIPC